MGLVLERKLNDEIIISSDGQEVARFAVVRKMGQRRFDILIYAPENVAITRGQRIKSQPSELPEVDKKR